jgi:uncharacterized membrane protein YedE/YeeE
MKILFFLIAMVSGFYFGAGLVLSGMSDPVKVWGFLDILGSWDPSLALVMAGGMAVMFFAYFIVSKKNKPFLPCNLELPQAQKVDRQLVMGAAIFGIGWGLSGLCPGPAWVMISTHLVIGDQWFAYSKLLAVLLAGMALARRVQGRLN